MKMLPWYLLPSLTPKYATLIVGKKNVVFSKLKELFFCFVGEVFSPLLSLLENKVFLTCMTFKKSLL